MSYNFVAFIPAAYPAMSQWLNRTGRPMIFSCSWPAYQEGKGMQVNDNDFGFFLFNLAYPAMSQWLNRTGRPMLFSCSWPAYQEGKRIKV